MSQSDFGVINPNTKSGTQLAVDLNGFRDAVNSGHSGSTRPAYLPAGGHWVRIVSSIKWDLVFYDGSVDYTLRSVNPTTGQKIGIPAADLADKQTSATDNTAGRLLTVGAFGLGYNVGGGLVDFNTVIWTGFFEADGIESQGAALNWPSTGLAGTTPVWFNLQTSSNNARDRISQIATECYSAVPGVRQWIRTKHDAYWEPWVEVATSASNFGVNGVRIDVASAATVNLTTAAPNTRHINITGTTAITGFTVAAGQTYFVRFNAALTLTNNASIVTQSGANITTAAGDTCILRATAANVVEVLTYTPFLNQSVGYGQTWQDVTGSRVLGTTYTNSTGKPIAVHASFICPNNSSAVKLLVNGVQAGLCQGAVSASVSYGVGTGIVTNGATYSITIIGGTPSIQAWSELR